jgi:4-aminobutyrate aminotransferase / (S)-3-amino-2-methylpropionate transaminase / 5-aminovalerate transaminase
MNQSETPSSNLIARRRAVVPPGVAQFAGDTVALSAHGSHIDCPDGTQLLDFAGGIGVMNVGHCNERVVEAIREQAGKLIHTCIHVATYEPYVALCEKLVELLPHGASTKAMLANSGAEAVENAVKIARQATARGSVICFTEAFHGRTLMGMTLTSKTKYKLGCGPFAPEVYRVPYPRPFHDGAGLTEEQFVKRELARLKDTLSNRVDAEQVAAIIIEPVLGEGGFIAAPIGYMQGLRQLCDDNGIMLICDEVQTGFCRTGYWGAYEHFGIVPDLSTWAKSMGGGMPISAVIGKTEVMDKARPGTIGGTFGGNPVACAAALATISVMEDLDLNARARHIGQLTRERFESLATRSELVADVRGLGAMIGLELCHERDPSQPATDEVAAIIAGCRKRGVLVMPAGRNGNVLRILSPLVISDEDLDRGLSAIEDAVLELTDKAIA